MRRLETSEMLKHSGHSNKGFALIELLVVVAVIMIVAAIAIPNLLRAKGAANSTSAVSTLKTINTAEQMYFTSCATYAPDLLALGPPSTAGATPGCTDAAPADLVDAVVAGLSATNAKSNYILTYAAGTANGSYTILADPDTSIPLNPNHYFTDQSGVIRLSVGSAAGVTSTPI